MNVDERLASDLALQMQAIEGQMAELTRTAVVWMVVSVLLLVFLLVILVVLLRMRARNRKVENWLVKEMQAVQDGQRAIAGRLDMPQASSQAAPRLPAKKKAAPVPPSPAAQAAPREPFDLTATINEMLAGNQPYNFVESIRAIEPRLSLQRLTPHASGDVFEKDVTLELGGDGLFACIDGDRAQLYPNYSRFSATLDPKPLFEGARHGARIHSILQPALLKKQDDTTWILLEKGRVQMRQGN